MREIKVGALSIVVTTAALMVLVVPHPYTIGVALFLVALAAIMFSFKGNEYVFALMSVAALATTSAIILIGSAWLHLDVALLLLIGAGTLFAASRIASSFWGKTENIMMQEARIYLDKPMDRIFEVRGPGRFIQHPWLLLIAKLSNEAQILPFRIEQIECVGLNGSEKEMIEEISGTIHYKFDLDNPKKTLGIPSRRALTDRAAAELGVAPMTAGQNPAVWFKVWAYMLYALTSRALRKIALRDLEPKTVALQHERIERLLFTRLKEDAATYSLLVSEVNIERIITESEIAVRTNRIIHDQLSQYSDGLIDAVKGVTEVTDDLSETHDPTSIRQILSFLLHTTLQAVRQPHLIYTEGQSPFHWVWSTNTAKEEAEANRH